MIVSFRLNYQGLFDDESVTVHPSMLTKLWLPDLFFANEKKANFHKVTQDNKLVRIYKNGDIYISVRITLTLGNVRICEYFHLELLIECMTLYLHLARSRQEA